MIKTYPTVGLLQAYLEQEGLECLVAGGYVKAESQIVDRFFEEAQRLHPEYNEKEALAWAVFTAVTHSHLHPKAEKALKVESADRVWLWVWRIAVLLALLALCALQGFAQGTSQIDVITFTDGGVPVVTYAAPFSIECGANLVCSRVGSILTIDASGGSGTGCVPPGTSTRFLYDDGAGGCADSGLTYAANTLTAPNGQTITYSGTGNVNARNWAGTGITNTESLGKIPIGNGDGTATWSDPFVSGITAHDAVGTSTNPVLIGGYASAAAPTNVSADGDAVRGWFLLNGAQVMNLASGGTLVTLGQKAMAASLPVVLASDQASIPVAATLSAETTKAIGVVRNADGAGNLLTSNSTTYTAKFGLDSNILGTLGTAFTTPGFVDIKGADGNVFVRQTTGTNLHMVVDSGTVTTVSTVTNLSQLGGTAISMNTGVRDAGTQRVTIATNDVVPASQSGTWNITNVSGTVSLPTGASTLAEQQTQTTSLQLIDNIVSGTGANISQMNGVNVSMGAGVVGTGVQRVVLANNEALPPGTNVIGHTIIDSGSTTAVTGNVTVVQATGTNLHIVCDGGTCGGASPFADNSAFTFGTSGITTMGAVVDDTATNTVAENSAGTPRMNTNRILYQNPRNNAGTEIFTTAAPGTVQIGDSVNGPTAVKPAIGTASIPATFTTAGATNANPAVTTTRSPNSGIPAIIQKVSAAGTGSQASLGSGNFAATVTAGNSLVAVVAVGNNGSIKVTDTLGNAWTQAKIQSNSTTFTVGIFYATNIVGGTDACTVTPSASVSVAIACYEVSGIIGAGGGGATNANSTANQQGSTGASVSASGTSVTPASGADSIIFPNQLAFGGIAIGTANQTPSAFNPWNKDASLAIGGTPAGLFGLHSFSQPMGAAPASVSLTATITSEPWAAAVVSFRPAMEAVGGSVTALCQFNTTPPTLSSADGSAMQCNNKGEQLTQLTDGTNNVNVIAGTNALKTDTASIAGTATSVNSGTMDAGTQRTVQASIGNPCYLQSAASTNSTSCKGSAGTFYGVRGVNTTTTTYYLRLYNSSGAPTCSSATGFIESIPIPPGPAASTASGIMGVTPLGIAYGTGIGYCFTGGGSSTDNTNAATGVYLAIYAN